MTSAPAASPFRLEGELDPQLRRWLWSEKRLLAVPHVIVLAFMWTAFIVTCRSRCSRSDPCPCSPVA